VKSYTQLLKLRLSWLVVFSAVITYLMADIRYGVEPNWWRVLMLTIGGFLVTGSSNAFNQIIEKDFDRLMVRTENRPMPRNEISNKSALLFSGITALTGLAILWIFLNPLSGILGLSALVLYVAVYTPMKRATPFAVFVGALPGAVPPLLGWTASTGQPGFEGWVLFAIQFMWQFPHFWALAWMLHDDYLKAGFRMLPAADGRSKTSAMQIMFYTAGIIPIGLLPYMFGITGIVSAIITTACGILFMLRSMQLHRSLDISDARKLLFASFIYLPVVQLALMFDTKPLP
jgi:heme o synthase